MRNKLTRTGGIGLVVATALTATIAAPACKKDERMAAKASAEQRAELPAELARPRPAGNPAQLASPALLAHVPADTPFVLGSLAPVPVSYWAKVRDALGGQLGPVIDAALAADGGDDEGLRLLDALRAELDGKWTEAGLTALGLSASPHVVMYGLGLLPVVVRMDIGDEAVLRATIERVAQRAQLTLPASLERDGRRYWRVDAAADASVIVALADRQLVLGFGPPAAIDAQLPMILGAQKPADSLAASKGLQAAYAAHGFGPHVLGYVDVAKMLDAAFALAGAPSDACRAETAALAARAPRVVMGYDMSSSRLVGGLVVELAPDLRDRVAGLRRAVPGLLGMLGDTPMMAMGLGVDLVRGQQLLRDGVERLGELGTACGLDAMAHGADEVATGLAQPLPPMVAGIAGGAIALHDIALGAGSPKPRKVEAAALLVADQPKALLDALGQVLPVSVPADGKLHDLALPFLSGQLPEPVAAGVGPRAIVVATGAKGRASATRALAAGGDGTVPLVAMAYDYGRLLALQNEMTRAFAASAGIDDPTLAAQAAVNEAMAKIYGRASAVVDVTDKGLVMWGAFEIK